MKKDFSFYLVTDTHFFNSDLGCSGKPYEEFMDFEQKCFAETEEINLKLFGELMNRDDCKTILIPGDLSFNGEYESHVKFSHLLQRTKSKGKDIYVITAGHDVAKNPFEYTDEGRTPVKNTTFDDLYSFYRDFGYDKAVSFNREHLSYTADISDDVRLLALCNDITNSEGEIKTNVEYDDEFVSWIENECKRAKADGKFIIAMEHYPLIAGKPIFEVIGNARQKNARRVLDTLANNGCHLVFTGHMHNQSINEYITPSGNKITDVCTGSAIGWPSFFRKVTITADGTAKIESEMIPEFEHKNPEISSKQYLIRQFDAMIRNIVLSMKSDPSRILRKFGIKDNKNLYPIVKVVGKILGKATVGGAAKLFRVKIKDLDDNEMIHGENLTEEEKEVRIAQPYAYMNAAECKDVKILDIACGLVRSIFEGNSPYTDKTVMGKAVCDLLEKLNNLVFRHLKIKGSQGEKIDLYECLVNSIGKYEGSDYTAEIKL